METIRINRTEYDVVESATAEQRDEQNLHNLARMMREYGMTRQIVGKRPKGNKLYMIQEYMTRHGLYYRVIGSY